MSRQIWRNLLVFCALGFLLSACGQTGDLRLPESPSPSPSPAVLPQGS